MLRDEVGAEEGQARGEGLEEGDAECVEIGGDRDRRAGDLLGRHVRERADQAARLRLAEIDEVRDAEVAELCGAAGVEEHVRRLDVAMHDPAMVRGFEPADDVEGHAPDLRAGEAFAACEALRERAAGQVLHHEKAALDRDVVDLDERRMPERAREPRLAHEPFVGGAAARARREEHLECDRAAGDLVGCQKYAAGCAGAEQALEPIASCDDLAIAAGLALGGLIAPRPQIRVEIGGNLGIHRAQLEQRVARAVAKPHRGERRDEVTLRFGTKLGMSPRILEQARRLGVRAAAREDSTEGEL